MGQKTEIVIKDACILFDLIDLDILDHFYQLELIVFTSPQVIEEISNESQLKTINYYVENKKLLIDAFGNFEIIQELFNINPGLSFTDCSVLELAIRKRATILSSDKSLRNESQRRNIPVKGVLWILEELYLKGHLSKEQIINKITKYPEFNKRAPIKETAKLIERLSNL